ncbi:hypothetical protein GIB67_025838 [Kingdonia uniflora]|uniref:SMG7 n=1 Tax=Kingdonia uniflora TaxID=39325 RepID=A0A7J7N4V4_9MAGN|nr:hypothetical protein GIB67_025838 [Kingdonia uniflora]
MMPVPMDNMSAPSSLERCQRLLNLNVEIQKSVKARNSPDSNAWRQMRDNYQSIILEDHDFSEQHDVEYALWQLHHRRIVEFRARLNAAMRSLGSATSQGGNTPARAELADQVQRIRNQFKNFISEATGFYHELISAIRTKYKLLPPSYFSEDLESHNVIKKDGEESSDIKEGIMSCHRCLIYLGDLARYKSLYGEGESKSRDYVNASNYYKEAASLCPSSGNPHHQLAILASYSGDDLLAVYRYFRSLAVRNPFLTARDNLIIAFEKNRESYLEQSKGAKASLAKAMSARKPGKGRAKVAITSSKEKLFSMPEIYQAFCIRFVRLNGILFTRTSLETFGEVFALVTSDLHELLSSGTEEKINFGKDAAENRLAIVMVISILVYTVHDANRESKGQSYAEILQRPVLLQNAFIAAFEIAGHIIKRCIQLEDISSSFFLPGILVFLEWLACSPNIAINSEAEEKQATAWSFFWNQCTLFFNRLMLICCVSNGDEDVTRLANMSRYDEGVIGNRLALWEDFELRGFVPLLSAQLTLDFSRNPVGNDSGMKGRIQRIIAAGRSLAGVVRINQQGLYYSQKEKKFIIGADPKISEGSFMLTSPSEVLKSNRMARDNHVETTGTLGILRPQCFSMEGEDEEEEIVFKPTMAEKVDDLIAPKLTTYGVPGPVEIAAKGELASHNFAPLSSLNALEAASKQIPASFDNTAPLQQQPLNSSVSNWLLEHQAYLFNGMRNLNVAGNGHAELVERVVGSSELPAFAHSDNFAAVYDENKDVEIAMPPWFHSLVASGANNDAMTVKPANLKKNPVGRPVRHPGPPPGFSPVPPKPVDTRSDWKSGNVPLDHGWIDRSQLPSSTKGMAANSSINYNEQVFSSYAMNNNDSLTNSAMSFPFPGKQLPMMHTEVENQNIWQDYQLLDHLKLHSEPQQQQLTPGTWAQQANQQAPLLPEQYQGNSLWSGRSFV